ncbi:MAG: SusE domain-containing protein [Alistipes sp.]|nr:SusE domain-containing protein [Alistipes sp.]
MKLMKYVALFVAVAGLFSACTSDLEKIQTLPDDQLVAPVLKELAVSEVAITPDNLSEKIVVEWEDAFFGENIIFNYVLSFTFGDKSMDVITGYTKNSVELTYNQIKTALVTLGVKDGEAADIKLRVSAQVGSTGKVLYTDYATLKASYTETKEETPEGGENTEE